MAKVISVLLAVSTKGRHTLSPFAKGFAEAPTYLIDTFGGRRDTAKSDGDSTVELTRSGSESDTVPAAASTATRKRSPDRRLARAAAFSLEMHASTAALRPGAKIVGETDSEGAMRPSSIDSGTAPAATGGMPQSAIRAASGQC